DQVILFNLIALNNWVGEPSTVMFRRDRIGTGFDTNFFHYGDIDYWFRVLAGSDFYYLSEVLCGFRRHSLSGTTQNHRSMLSALDLLRLGHKYGEVLGQLGESKDHFARRAVEVAALNLEHQINTQGLSIEEVVALGVKAKDMERVLAGFKE